MLEDIEQEETRHERQRQALPWSPEMQQRLLGNIVKEPKIAEAAARLGLLPESFSDRTHEVICRTVLDFRARYGRHPDETEILHELGKTTRKEDDMLRMRVELRLCCDYLVQALCENSNLHYWTDQLKDFCQTRAFVRLALETVGKKKIDLDKVMERLAAIKGTDTVATWEPIDEFIESALAQRVKWHVQDRLPAGQFVLLAGHEKAGKSVLTYSLVASLLTGSDWLGLHVENTPVNVVVLNWENPKEYAGESLVGCMLLDQWRAVRSHARWVEAKRLPRVLTVAYLDSVTRDMEPGVLVVDSLMAALGPQFAARVGGSYTPEIVAAALQPLLEWCHGTGWTIIGLHHLNKTGSTACSYEFRARPDILWDYAGEGKSVRTLEFGGRLLHKPATIKVGWDNDRGCPRLHVEAKDDGSVPLRQRILAALPEDEAGALTKQQLVETLGVSEKPVRAVLADLEEQLEVLSEKRGEQHAKYYWRKR